MPVRGSCLFRYGSPGKAAGEGEGSSRELAEIKKLVATMAAQLAARPAPTTAPPLTGASPLKPPLAVSFPAQMNGSALASRQCAMLQGTPLVSPHTRRPHPPGPVQAPAARRRGSATALQPRTPCTTRLCMPRTALSLPLRLRSPMAAGCRQLLRMKGRHRWSHRTRRPTWRCAAAQQAQDAGCTMVAITSIRYQCNQWMLS